MKRQEIQQTYEAPRCRVIEMQTEGVILTGSDTTYGDTSHEGFQEEDYSSIWDN